MAVLRVIRPQSEHKRAVVGLLEKRITVVIDLEQRVIVTWLSTEQHAKLTPGNKGRE